MKILSCRVFLAFSRPGGRGGVASAWLFCESSPASFLERQGSAGLRVRSAALGLSKRLTWRLDGLTRESVARISCHKKAQAQLNPRCWPFASGQRSRPDPSHASPMTVIRFVPEVGSSVIDTLASLVVRRTAPTTRTTPLGRVWTPSTHAAIALAAGVSVWFSESAPRGPQPLD